MSYNHHHVSHQPLPPSEHSPLYPPPGFPPPSPPVGYTRTHHSPSPPPPPPGCQGYYYEGYPSSSPGLPPPPQPPRNDYNHSGCTSLRGVWLLFVAAACWRTASFNHYLPEWIILGYDYYPPVEWVLL